MSVFIKAQEASVSARFWDLRDFSRFSITSVRSPVSMALELATARRMLARETDTLPELFLRTIGRLRNEKTKAIVAPGKYTVPSVFGRAFLWQLANKATLSSKLAPLSSNPALTRQQRLISNNWSLKAGNKRNLGGLGYE